MRVTDIPTPALLVDADVLDRNIATMAEALPGPRLRPHVKAHKCTGLARRQAEAGHSSFTCATIRECEGMAAAGLGDDLLLANEVLDATRLGNLVGCRRPDHARGGLRADHRGGRRRRRARGSHRRQRRPAPLRLRARGRGSARRPGPAARPAGARRHGLRGSRRRAGRRRASAPSAARSRWSCWCGRMPTSAAS